MIRKTVPKIKEVLRKALLGGITPKNLALSVSTGVYIAFSPFPGAHTIMMLACRWLFKMHLPTLFIFTSINNPWTMIPFFSADYAFGYWLLHKCIGWDPGWTISLAKVFGSGSICIWSFFIGGNILGIIAGLASYPLVRIFFDRMLTRIQAHRGNP
jgi:uncharacterized protein (DUF2062 family)